ncbi:unnamed protein product [Clonostachys rosea f. rosea IK726]|uniref:Uncharacterized protein n=1 Tax=Clonostachys rosea f. rosea IK726 TaxID=1349383 RepID=A0ACA9U870_BIOOC|nr:unnamed protein product [Clonostachys rosea f. rosea IK726]
MAGVALRLTMHVYYVISYGWYATSATRMQPVMLVNMHDFHADRWPQHYDQPYLALEHSHFANISL